MKLSKLSLFALATIASSFTVSAETITYKVDPVHSGVDFKIRHFINKIPGTFSQFSGEIVYDKENLENSKASATIEIASVDTRNEDRDQHLVNEDFFNISKNPKITFESTEWISTGENTYDVKGILSFNGVSNPIVLKVTYLGEVEGRGTIRSGWEGTATIDRTDWNMGYGSPAVGKDVDIELNIQAHRQ